MSSVVSPSKLRWASINCVDPLKYISELSDVLRELMDEEEFADFSRLDFERVAVTCFENPRGRLREWSLKIEAMMSDADFVGMSRGKIRRLVVLAQS